MRKTMMVWSACAAALLPAVAASTAAADAVPNQDIGQAATSSQSAGSAATSTQSSPTNQAIHVAILSPGAATGAVSQSNSSAAQSAAGNANNTTQNAAQSGGWDAGGGVQAVGQGAASEQAAPSAATSTQSNPTNQAIDVAILSPGAGSAAPRGAVSQSNRSAADSKAGNSNTTKQDAEQSGGDAVVPVRKLLDGCSTCHVPSSPTVQGIGQAAYNRQSATSTATSTQDHPSNTAIHVAILSPGAHGGRVSQSNSSAADSTAGNTNATTQDAAQSGGGSGGVQPIGQLATNAQSALSAATSTQWCPANLAGGTAGGVKQSNDSWAGSAAGNQNRTDQNTDQSAGFPWPVVVL